MSWVRPDWKEQVIFECEGGDIKARPFSIEDGSILNVINFNIKTNHNDINGSLFCAEPDQLIWFSRLLEFNATLLDKDSDENTIIK